MPKIYVAAAMADKELASDIINYLHSFGMDITFNWPQAEQIKVERPLLAVEEINGVKAADVLVFVTPGGRGAHTELGVALGNNIPVVLYDKGMDDKYDYPPLFHEHPEVYKTSAAKGFEAMAVLVGALYESRCRK